MRCGRVPPAGTIVLHDAKEEKEEKEEKKEEPTKAHQDALNVVCGTSYEPSAAGEDKGKEDYFSAGACARRRAERETRESETVRVRDTSYVTSDSSVTGVTVRQYFSTSSTSRH